nr:golgin subfamily A member 2-like isoform X2 [Macaca nemestrina]
MGGPVLGHWWHSGGKSLAEPSLPPPSKSSVFLFLQEKQESQQNQGALKRQLQVSGGCEVPSCPLENVAFLFFQHLLGFSPKGSNQVTGILMFEKAELNTALYHTEHAARQFEEEAEDLASHLQYSWKHVGELQREQRKADRYNNQLTGDSDALRLKLYKNSNSNKELKQENSALAEQLPVVLTDKAGMQRNLEELKKKLELTDLTLPTGERLQPRGWWEPHSAGDMV